MEVGRDGRPTGRVRLEPATESEEFNRRLRETLTSLRYSPGTRAGEPVVAWVFVFAVAMLFLAPIVIAGMLVIGVGDTWLDLRTRLRNRASG